MCLSAHARAEAVASAARAAELVETKASRLTDAEWKTRYVESEPQRGILALARRLAAAT